MICLDANVVIELMLKRPRWEACSRDIDSKGEGLAMTVLSVDLAMYFAEGKKLDLDAVQGLLRQFIWLPLIEADTNLAFSMYRGDDFEDALQLAVAKREGCERFATLDRGLHRKYSPAYPVDLLS